MPVIDYPKRTNVKYFNLADVYIVADSASTAQYCTENSISLVSYTAEEQRFSNDGALTYQYYDGAEWVTEFGFRRVVNKLTYS